MKANVKHFNNESLQLLVLGDEQSEEFRRTARHVETCSECQRRLHELAAPGEFESSVRSMLSKSSSDSLSGSASDSAVATNAGSNAEPIKLDFLSPPSHPEMLGRLGRYEIERVIGSGGMGIVLKAYDTELNRQVAVKVLARHLAHSGAAKARFAREAKAAAAVVHEHVIAIHNVEADRDLPFLVMQFVSGESLQARVDRVGPLEGKEILRIGIQIASGLAAAHEQGVLHRICHDRQRPVGEINCDIPGELSDCIDRLLEKKPQHRFASASDVEQTLCRLLATWQQGGIRRHPRFMHRWFGYVAAALVVAVGTVAIYQIPLGTSQQSLSTDSSPAKESTNEKALQLAEFDMAEQESIERNLKILELMTSESSFAKPSESFHQSVESIERGLNHLDGILSK